MVAFDDFMSKHFESLGKYFEEIASDPRATSGTLPGGKRPIFK